VTANSNCGVLHYESVRYAHNPSAYEAEEWSRPDEMALFQLLWSQTRRELDIRPNSRLLDACCGSGLSLLGAVSHPHLACAVGVDVSLRLLDFARRRYEPFGNVSFLCGDAVQQMFAPTSFDLIVASSAYHHIEHPRKHDFLSVCNRLLKQDGRLLVAENLLPSYVDDNAAYDDAVRRLYSAVKRSALEQFPNLPASLNSMIDENVTLSLKRQYEYKVHRRQALKDFGDSQFSVERELKAWPPEAGALDEDSGNFLFVLKKCTGSLHGDPTH
jgi:ubiquinone/menaquinone biosynthesis C-methylase UbiE